MATGRGVARVARFCIGIGVSAALLACSPAEQSNSANAEKTDGTTQAAVRRCMAQLTRAQCECAAKTLSTADFEAFARIVEIDAQDGSAEVKAYRKNAVITELGGGDMARTLAFAQGVKVAGSECGIS